MLILLANSSRPYCSTRELSIISNLIPCNGLFGCSINLIPISFYWKRIIQEKKGKYKKKQKKEPKREKYKAFSMSKKEAKKKASS